MAGVDKEDVIGFEAREEINIDLFDSFLNQINIAVESFRIGFDAGQLAAADGPHCFGGELG